jgi:PAS domain S-box-containing protein
MTAAPDAVDASGEVMRARVPVCCYRIERRNYAKSIPLWSIEDLFKNFAEVIRSVGTGYALMALAFLIVESAFATGKLDATSTFALSIFIPVVSLIAVHILRKDQGSVAPVGESQGQLTESEDDILKLQLRTFAEQSQLPIYFTNEKKIIEYCNPRLELLLGIRSDQITGSPVSIIIDTFLQLVPPDRRDDFLKRQNKALKEAETSKLAHICEVMDLRQRSYGDRGTYCVCTQAELICTKDKRPVGIVVISHLQEICIDQSGNIHFLELQSQTSR